MLILYCLECWVHFSVLLPQNALQKLFFQFALYFLGPNNGFDGEKKPKTWTKLIFFAKIPPLLFPLKYIFLRLFLFWSRMWNHFKSNAVVILHNWPGNPAWSRCFSELIIDDNETGSASLRMNLRRNCKPWIKSTSVEENEVFFLTKPRGERLHSLPCKSLSSRRPQICGTLLDKDTKDINILYYTKDLWYNVAITILLMDFF